MDDFWEMIWTMPMPRYAVQYIDPDNLFEHRKRFDITFRSYCLLPPLTPKPRAPRRGGASRLGGGRTTERGRLRPAERRPADMEPADWE